MDVEQLLDQAAAQLRAYSVERDSEPIGQGDAEQYVEQLLPMIASAWNAGYEAGWGDGCNQTYRDQLNPFTGKRPPSVP